MKITELNNKIENLSAELRSEIINYVKENAKFKVGDVIKSGISDFRTHSYFVVRQVGFRDKEIVYYGSKIIKSTGEVSYQDMDSNIGTPERAIKKATLKVKKEEISFIKENKYFDYNIRIDVSI